MNAIKVQCKKLRNRVKWKLEIISDKLKRLLPKSRELTNQDIETCMMIMAGRSECSEDYLSDAKVELLHDRMTRLSEDQMNIVNLYYFQKNTLSSVAKITGKPRSSVWFVIQESLRIMRE